MTMAEIMPYFNLHTSKRMHFIEEKNITDECFDVSLLHTSKRMHFIEDVGELRTSRKIAGTCIRQNVCTSLRMQRITMLY